MDDQELLWNQYSNHIDLYKFYITWAIKLNVFYYAISGAILSFCFANSQQPLIQYSLILPVIMSIGLTWLFLYGAKLLEITRNEVFKIRDTLGLMTAPEFRVLSAFLYGSSTALIIVSVGLLALVFFWESIFGYIKGPV